MNRNARKHEVASKVKEIKQRQKNWMKQRAEIHNQSTEDTEDSPTFDSSRHPLPLFTANKSTELAKKSQPEKSSQLDNLLSSKRSNAKFENWIKAKHTNSNENETDDYSSSKHDTKEYNSSNYIESNYGNNLYRDHSYRDHQGSEEVNVLRVPSSRSAEYATPDPSYNSEDETGEITAAQLFSPEDFDAVADSIINKVKGDMGLGSRNKTLHVVNSAKGKSVRDEHYGKTRESKTGDGYLLKRSAKASSGKANHVCPTCDKLMVPPQRSPMLLVPCGHTLCEQCSRRTKYCGMCGSVVESYTPNVMLEQIITNYNSNQSEYVPVEQSSHKTKGVIQYREEYQNLQTREDILEEESENIDRRIIQLSKELSAQNQQIENIQAQEEKVAAEVHSLQKKLQTLQTHRQEYEHSCDTIQMDYKQEKNRLLMVKESIDSIKKQKEKVKLLAENGY